MEMLKKSHDLEHGFRQADPEIKTPFAVSVRDAAMLVIEKRNNANEWKSGQMPSGEVFDDFQCGGVSERVDGLQVNVSQRKDSSINVDILYSTTGLYNTHEKPYEFTLLDTNARGEAIFFLPDRNVCERLGVTQDEFAYLVTERLEGMASKIDLQSSIQQENTLETSSVQVANERSVSDLTPEVSLREAAQSEKVELVQEVPKAVASDSSTWIESLKSQLDNIDASELKVFSGSTKVYERVDNVVTKDELKTELGQKVQQALSNPAELKGIVKVLADGDKVYDARDGKVSENKYSLAIDNSQVTQTKSLNVAQEVSQVSEVQTQNLPVTQEKTLEPAFEVHQVAQVQEQILNVSPVVENKINTNNLDKNELSSSASFDSRSGRQIFSMPLNSFQPKLDDRMPKEANTVEVKIKDNPILNEPQPHRPHKQIFSVPLNPTPVELDAKMPEVVNSNRATERGSVEQALASANARIDSLQTQLKDTQKTLEDLSKFVRNDNLKSWAEHKVTEVAKTSQSIAEQAKNKVMQWMQAKAVQVKLAIHDKVNDVKTAAQDKVNEVKTVAQDKVNEVKTVAQNKVSEVKIATQDKVNEVKTAAQLKGIEFKESVREQANKFLAPVNSAEVERAAKHIVREFGDGKSYNKAATHSFQVNDKNELSVARQSDGAVIYQKGALTTAATSHDILKLNALPTVVNQIKVTQNLSHQKQGMEVGGR